jgi:hypothetical protein
MLRDENLSLRDIQEILGHAHLSTTQTYLEQDPEDVIRRVHQHLVDRQRRDQQPPSIPVPASGYNPDDLAVLLGEQTRWLGCRSQTRPPRRRPRRGRRVVCVCARSAARASAAPATGTVAGVEVVAGLTARTIVECMPSTTSWVALVSTSVKPAATRPDRDSAKERAPAVQPTKSPRSARCATVSVSANMADRDE